MIQIRPRQKLSWVKRSSACCLSKSNKKSGHIEVSACSVKIKTTFWVSFNYSLLLCQRQKRKGEWEREDLGGRLSIQVRDQFGRWPSMKSRFCLIFHCFNISTVFKFKITAIKNESAESQIKTQKSFDSLTRLWLWFFCLANKSNPEKN